MEKLETFLINYVEKMTADGVIPKICYTGDRDTFDLLSNICEVFWYAENPTHNSPDMALLVGEDANGDCAWGHIPGIETVVTAAYSVPGALQGHFNIVDSDAEADIIVYTNSEKVAGCLNRDVDVEIETIIDLEEIEEVEPEAEIQKSSTTLPPPFDWGSHQ